MSWTKRQIVEEAFGELALAGYVFDLQPEELQAALRKLDAMVATWTAQGLRLGYAAASSPDESDLDQDSGLQMIAIEAVYLNLAVRLAASKGKVLAASTKMAAKAALDTLESRQASDEVQQQQLPNTMPRGAGARWRNRDNPFMSSPDTAPLQVGDDGGLVFGD
jgi:hypothetical protein